MDPPRVFLICVNRLVCEAVNALLHREGIDLLGMETDPELGLEQVRALDPDVVLVEGYSPRDPLSAITGNTVRKKASRQATEPETISGSKLISGLTRLAYEKGNLRIIHLSLPHEDLMIYRQEHRRFINTYDLVAAIRSSAPIENI